MIYGSGCHNSVEDCLSNVNWWNIDGTINSEAEASGKEKLISQAFPVMWEKVKNSTEVILTGKNSPDSISKPSPFAKLIKRKVQRQPWPPKALPQCPMWLIDSLNLAEMFLLQSYDWLTGWETQSFLNIWSDAFRVCNCCKIKWKADLYTLNSGKDDRKIQISM